MPPSIIKLSAAGLAALVLSGPATALDEVIVERGWAQVDYVEQGECRAEVRTNGQFYRIAGAGLQPGEEVGFHLENEDIKPVHYRVVANSDGMWRKFYVPFLWHRDGGTVQVDLQSASCSLALSFDWTRRQP